MEGLPDPTLDAKQEEGCDTENNSHRVYGVSLFLENSGRRGNENCVLSGKCGYRNEN